DYRWLGHFQPAKMSVDATTKAISAAEDGKRLWVVPARPDSFVLEQGSGPLVTPRSTGAVPPSHPNRAMGPYVALRQKAVKGPASFAVLLYPAADSADGPRLEPLPSASKEDAAGFRVRRGTQDDLLVLAPASRLRRFGTREDGCVSDAEMAYARREGGQVTETALAAGRRLEVGGKTLITAGPEGLSVNVRYQGDTAAVSTRGRGEVRVAKGRTTKLVLNGKPVSTTGAGDEFRAEVGEAGTAALTALTFATDPAARCKGIGVPVGYG